MRVIEIQFIPIWIFCGLWGGMIAGLALQTLLLSFVLYRMDWNKELTVAPPPNFLHWGFMIFE
ncbi:hypothetical protein RND71_030186 [Anisodus tanguticus]|uniref:Uncharacterized protein n=1 Tax=Anisodus tanguticus TaxID=243964 RepID=A0AAE1UZF4_9SOLA|nr:hypothetical protein RND71_030186 [Anisodus tanguticus]